MCKPMATVHKAFDILLAMMITNGTYFNIHARHVVQVAINNLLHH